MGDRAVIEIQQTGGKVCLYSHSDGIHLRTVLAKALDRASDRWHDETYLTRIIFNEMTNGQEHSNLGYGIHVGEADDLGPDNPTIKMRWFDSCSNNDRYLQITIVPYGQSTVQAWFTPKEWIGIHTKEPSSLSGTWVEPLIVFNDILECKEII